MTATIAAEATRRPSEAQLDGLATITADLDCRTDYELITRWYGDRLTDSGHVVTPPSRLRSRREHKVGDSLWHEMLPEIMTAAFAVLTLARGEIARMVADRTVRGGRLSGRWTRANWQALGLAWPGQTVYVVPAQRLQDCGIGQAVVHLEAPTRGLPNPAGGSIPMSVAPQAVAVTDGHERPLKTSVKRSARPDEGKVTVTDKRGKVTYVMPDNGREPFRPLKQAQAKRSEGRTQHAKRTLAAAVDHDAAIAALDAIVAKVTA